MKNYILVTGSSSYIGKNLINILEKKKLKYVGIDVAKPFNSKCLKLNILDQKIEKKIKKKISIKKLGGIINESWFLKKHFSKLISNNKIDNLYKKILEKGAYGGKLLGAGNGGFYLFYVIKIKIFFLKIYLRKIIISILRYCLINQDLYFCKVI